MELSLIINIVLSSTTSGQTRPTAMLQYHCCTEQADTTVHYHFKSFDYPLSACTVTMAAESARHQDLQHDILIAFLPAYTQSPGVRVLILHLVLCHKRGETRSTGNRANCLLPAVPGAKTAVWLEQRPEEDEALIPL